MLLRCILFIHHTATVCSFALCATLLLALAAPRPLWRTFLLALFALTQAFSFFKLLVYAYHKRDPLAERIKARPQMTGALLVPALLAAVCKLGVPLLLA